jgi:D-alanyl-D-alanine carboxypeptidase
MLRVKIKRRRTTVLIIACAIGVSSLTLALLFWHGAQEQMRLQREQTAFIQQADKTIARLKTERIAKEKAAAEQKAKAEAEQKAASDAALSSQLNGQVIAPKVCGVSGTHGNPSSVDVVINKKRCFSPINFAPSDLTSYNGYLVSAKIVPDLTAMSAAASSAGVPFGLTSAYRSYSDQVATYNTWVRVNGSTAAADTVSARPGYSEHQTGFAVDVSAGSCSLECFRGSAQYQWMKNNAATYGFIERYQPGSETITGYSSEA